VRLEDSAAAPAPRSATRPAAQVAASSAAPAATAPLRQSQRARKDVDYSKLHKVGFFAADGTEDKPGFSAEDANELFYVCMSTEARISLHKYVKGPNKERGIEAARAEVKNLIDNKTGVPMHFNELTQEDIKNLSHGFTFLKDQYKPDGDFKKTKARFVVNGKDQPAGTFEETASPTVRPETIFVLFGLTALEGLEFMAYDIPSAFLKARVPEGTRIPVVLDEVTTRIWIEQRPDDARYVSRNKLIIMLRRYLYGLKQSPRKWFVTLRDFYISLGYVAAAHDPCLFIKVAGEHFLLAPVHVDDQWVVGTPSPNPLRDELTAAYKRVFGAYTEEDGTNFIGLHIEHAREERAIYVDMSAYLASLEEKYPALRDARTYRTAAPPDFFDHRKDTSAADPATSPVPVKDFLSLLMALYFPARFVRPDLLPFLGTLARHAQDPTQRHLAQLQHIYGYVKFSLGLRLRIAPLHDQIGASIDASFGLHHDGRSHTGAVVTMGGAPIFFRSSKQSTVALSSTDAETNALAQMIPDIIWARGLLQDLNHPQVGPAEVEQDNQSNIALCQSPDCSFSRSRHLFIKLHYIREKIEDGVIRLHYVPTTRLVADLLTKLVAGAIFWQLMQRLFGYAPMG
jgi:hypothetical protein